MTDDLATRLRALLDRVPDSDAVIIDKTDMLALLDALTVRDAVIAEALAVPAYWTPNGATDGVRRAEHMRSILAATGEEYVYAPGGPSRVPQGAAEPNQHICFSGCRCGGQGTTVAWTDPKPFRQREGTVRSDMTLPWVHDPRSREQYDAEEGTNR